MFVPRKLDWETLSTAQIWHVRSLYSSPVNTPPAYAERRFCFHEVFPEVGRVIESLKQASCSRDTVTSMRLKLLPVWERVAQKKTNAKGSRNSAVARFSHNWKQSALGLGWLVSLWMSSSDCPHTFLKTKRLIANWSPKDRTEPVNGAEFIKFNCSINSATLAKVVVA